jgi:peptidoglycan/LPS O-acetylase OafA/YrhL
LINKFKTLSFIKPNKIAYYNEIDFIKAVAIIFVILLHSIPSKVLYKIYAPFYIWQAVPIFMVVAGITNTLSELRNTNMSFMEKYFVGIKKSVYRIFIPYFIVWLFEAIIYIAIKKATIGSLLKSLVTGGWGPGSYFVPIYLQYILLFPLITKLNKIATYNNHSYVLIVSFIISVLFEWLCVILKISSQKYRLFFIRYYFAVVLGSYLVNHKNAVRYILLLSPLSIGFIYIVAYLKVNIPFFPNFWIFQLAPSYFYTVFVLLFFWFLYNILGKLSKPFIQIGKASFHIFLVQMVWFWKFCPFLRKYIANKYILIVISIIMCLLVGYIFYKIQSRQGKIKKKYPTYHPGSGDYMESSKKNST